MRDTYITCVSLPGIYKICTTRNPRGTLSELNAYYPRVLPIPYIPEFWVKINNADQRKRELCDKLKKASDTEDLGEGYFRANHEDLHKLFVDMGGGIWVEDLEESPPQFNRIHVKGRYDCNMSKYIRDRQKICHNGTCPRPWIGIYDSLAGGIVYDGKIYKTPSAFAKEHYKVERPDRKFSNANGWGECGTEIDGEWKCIHNLRV